MPGDRRSGAPAEEGVVDAALLTRDLDDIERASPGLLAALAKEAASGEDDPIATIVSRAARRASSLNVVLPQRVGIYTLREELGSGGSGEVFLADQDVTGRRVALKLLALDDVDDTEPFEATAIGQLEHAGIASVLGAGEAEVETIVGPRRARYIAVQYLPGRHVTAHVSLERMSPDDRLGVVRDLAVTLEYLHRQGVVHGDLKPQNVLIDASGRPRIVDFGVANIEKFGIRRGPIAGAGFTLGYAPPEAGSSGWAPDEASDLFSFGVLAHEVLSSNLPSAGASPSQLCDELLGAGFEISRALPIAHTLGRCLVPDPKHRLASAGVVCQAIDRAIDGGWSAEQAGAFSLRRRAAAWGARARRGLDRSLRPLLAASVVLAGTMALSWWLRSKESSRLAALLASQNEQIEIMREDLSSMRDVSSRQADAASRLVGLAKDTLSVMASGNEWTARDIMARVGQTHRLTAGEVSLVAEPLFEHGRLRTVGALLRSWSPIEGDPTAPSVISDVLRLERIVALARGRPDPVRVPVSQRADGYADLCLDAAFEAIGLGTGESLDRLASVRAPEGGELPRWFVRARSTIAGRAARSRGELSEAEQLFRRAMSLTSDDPSPLAGLPIHPQVELAVVLADTGRPREAALLLIEFLEHDARRLPEAHPVRLEAALVCARACLVLSDFRRTADLVDSVRRHPDLAWEFPAAVDRSLVTLRDLRRLQADVKGEIDALTSLISLRLRASEDDPGKRGAARAIVELAELRFRRGQPPLPSRSSLADDLDHVRRLSGGSSWLSGRLHTLLAEASLAEGDKQEAVHHATLASELAQTHQQPNPLSERARRMLREAPVRTNTGADAP